MASYLVIGGSSGIGKSIVNRLVQSGHSVFATYHTHQSENTPGVTYAPLNVLDDDIQLPFLPEALDGLVYCPGSIDLKPFHRIKIDDLQNDFDLQVKGIFKVLQACYKNLLKSDQASVVFFSTVASQLGFPFHAQVAASKGAIEGLTRSLAAEYAPKIRFNAIAPSITDTPLAAKLLSSDQKRENNSERHPLKRIGKPEDMANLANFLLSEEASWITGQIIGVDGGMSAIK